MKELLLILLFHKTVVLTPGLVDLEAPVVLTPPERLEAITPGAHLLVDVSSMIVWRNMEPVDAARERCRERFAPGSISAVLRSDESEDVVLTWEGATAIGDASVELLLAADGGVPVGVEFTDVVFESETPLRDVRITWKNWQM